MIRGHSLILPAFPLFPLYTPPLTCGLWCYYVVLQVPYPLSFAVAFAQWQWLVQPLVWVRVKVFLSLSQLDLATLSYTPGSLGRTWLLVWWIWSSPKAHVLPGFSAALLSSADLTDQEMEGNGSKVGKSWQLTGISPFNLFCPELKAFFLFQKMPVEL